MRLVFFVIFLFASIEAQDIYQVYPVMDLSGGLVNSLANSLMKDNQALVLDNYDINPYGNLERRKGMAQHYVDSKTGEPTIAIVPYYDGYEKKMLLLRQQSGHFTGDTVNLLYLLTLCDDGTSACTTTLYEGYYPAYRDTNKPFNVSYSNYNNNLSIAVTGSEMVIFDGDDATPARPIAPGQPKVVPFDGGGNINGTVRYKYLYRDVAGAFGNMSAPSWPVNPVNGKVLLYNIGPAWDSTVVPKTLIYREDSLSGIWNFLDSITSGQNAPATYLDTFTSLSVDTADFPWGFLDRDTEAYERPPGAPNISSIDTCTTDSFGIGIIGTSNWAVSGPMMVGYSILFEDKFGHESYMSAPVYDTVSIAAFGVDFDWQYKVTLTNIPVPVDSGIAKKFLLRTLTGAFVATPDATPYDWYKLIELEIDSTTFKDSMRAKHWNDTLYCAGYVEKDTVFGEQVLVITTVDEYSLGEEPENTCYGQDSLITFRPSAITNVSGRTYAIGNPQGINRLHFTKIGYPANWPSDKFINTSSQIGDWFVRVLGVGNDEVLMFRQNSIYQLKGLSFYQYSINEIINGVGLSAPRSLASGKNEIYFAHQTGIYKMSRFGSITEIPISFPIEGSIDSVGKSMVQAWGGIIDDEYWFSVSGKTYIYSESPVPHWKCYTIGVKDAVSYDYSVSSINYISDKWILLRDTDSLYRWNYSSTDTLDDTTHIVPKYQSKYFFEGSGREKVFWVDFYGTGACDSLMITFFKDYGEGKPGTAFDSVQIALDFDDVILDRVKVNEICENFSVGIRGYGEGNYTLKGYEIGWLPWDKGRK